MNKISKRIVFIVSIALLVFIIGSIIYKETIMKTSFLDIIRYEGRLDIDSSTIISKYQSENYQMIIASKIDSSELYFVILYKDNIDRIITYSLEDEDLLHWNYLRNIGKDTSSNLLVGIINNPEFASIDIGGFDGNEINVLSYKGVFLFFCDGIIPLPVSITLKNDNEEVIFSTND